MPWGNAMFEQIAFGLVDNPMPGSASLAVVFGKPVMNRGAVPTNKPSSGRFAKARIPKASNRQTTRFDQSLRPSISKELARKNAKFVADVENNGFRHAILAIWRMTYPRSLGGFGGR